MTGAPIPQPQEPIAGLSGEEVLEMRAISNVMRRLCGNVTDEEWQKTERTSFLSVEFRRVGIKFDKLHDGSFLVQRAGLEPKHLADLDAAEEFAVLIGARQGRGPLKAGA